MKSSSCLWVFLLSTLSCLAAPGTKAAHPQHCHRASALVRYSPASAPAPGFAVSDGFKVPVLASVIWGARSSREGPVPSLGGVVWGYSAVDPGAGNGSAGSTSTRRER